VSNVQGAEAIAGHDKKGFLSMKTTINMPIRPIHTPKQYEAVLKQIEALWEYAPGTPEGEQCEILCLLVENYEKKHFEIDAKYDPIDVIEFWMEQNGLSRKDLEPYIGHRGRVAEILNRKRPLTIAMIRNLTRAGIPAGMLIGEIRSTKATAEAKPKVHKTPKTTKSQNAHAHPSSHV